MTKTMILTISQKLSGARHGPACLVISIYMLMVGLSYFRGMFDFLFNDMISGPNDIKSAGRSCDWHLIARLNLF